MQMVKIKFQDAAQDARGALELAKRFTVICLPEDTYEVPAVALAALDELQLSYRILSSKPSYLYSSQRIGCSGV